MKYSANNKPLVCMMTHSTCYKGSTNGKPVGFLLHSTGANNKTLKRYVQPYETDSNYNELIKIIGKNPNKNDWNHVERQAGLNAWIGTLADGTVASIQTLPWDMRPWGCGSGTKGSCNGKTGGPFWIQAEICEDALSDKTYFDKVYKEACELIAYLCKMYGWDPNGYVMYNSVKVPVILCHKDANTLGLGSNHSDIYHWFNKYGKSMVDVRNDVAKLMNHTVASSAASTTTTSVIYRIRKTWADSASQIGAYSSLENAKAACDKAGAGYYVFDANGKAVYPVVATTTQVTTNFKIGDEVKLIAGAVYSSGKTIPSWVFNSKLYVRQLNADGTIVISTLKSGAITGTVNKKYLTAYKATAASTTTKPTTTPISTPAPKPTPTVVTLKIGDRVKMQSGAPVYGKSTKFANWVYSSTLYVRAISGSKITISTLKTGAVTGNVDKKYLTKI